MRDLKKWLILGIAFSGVACGSDTNDTVIAASPAPTPAPSAPTFPSPLPTPLPRGNGQLYAMLGTSILRFANPSTLAGNVTPQATIAGNSTRILGLTDIALDPGSDRLYAANVADILVFDNISTKNGDTPPSRVFNIGIQPFSLSYDRVRDVLYVGTDQGVFKVFQASVANGTLPSGLPFNGTYNGLALFPFDMRVDPDANRLIVSSCSTTNRAAGQVVATFDNAFQTTGNSTFTAMTSATNPFRSARDRSGRLVVNDAVQPIGPGIAMSTQERILAYTSDSGAPAPVLTINGAVKVSPIGAHQMSYDNGNDQLIVAATDKILFFDRFTTLTGTVAADSVARVLNLASFGSPCTTTALDTSR